MRADLFRRLLDITGSLGGLIGLSPLFALIALAIKLDSPGPVIHRAQRTGKAAKVFRLYKFRSMILGGDKKGPGVTGSCDNRITRVGRLLRRTKLDELPQLINVLFGDMSLVGPRPEDPRYVALYTARQAKILRVPPGITSAASLAFRHEEKMLKGPDWESFYCKQVMPAKLAIDLEYLDHRSLETDLRLIRQTILEILGLSPRRG